MNNTGKHKATEASSVTDIPGRPRLNGVAQILYRMTSTPLSHLELHLPLLTAAIIAMSVVSTAQFAIYWQWQDLAQRTTLLGAVYLDTLSASVAPAVASHDLVGTTQALQRTLNYYEGLRDERLFVLDKNGRLFALADRAYIGRRSNIPIAALSSRQGTLVVPRDEIVWVWRPLTFEDQTIGTLIAALNISPLYERRRILSNYVMAAGFGISIVAAALCVWILRRNLRPVLMIAKHLEDVAEGKLAYIPETRVDSAVFATLRQAFNQMVAAVQDREQLAARLSDQSRAAILGRLAATIVHEVKNPLGGMLAAIETLKKYGTDSHVRSEATGLLERGLETVESVIDATLDTYKLPDKPRRLTIQDLDDIRTLIEAETRQRQLEFRYKVDLCEPIPITAIQTRQVLLNLLLNACRATPRGGIVSLSATPKEAGVAFEITDTGPGLSAEFKNALTTGQPEPADGLGLTIVYRLIDKLNGQIFVEPNTPCGTRLLITLPYEKDGSLS